MSDYGHPGERPIDAIPFDQSELSNIAAMATLMTVAGVITILSGLLGIVSGIVGLAVSGVGPAQALGNLCGAALVLLVYTALGVWLILAGNAFRRVVRTDEADQAFLVTGLRQLRNVFLLKSVLIILSLVAICAVFVIGMFLATSAPAGGF